MQLMIVEDNDGLREQMKWALCDTYSVIEASTADDCYSKFKKDNYHLVCLDMGLDNIPDKGLDIIDTLLKWNRNVKIIVITANTSDILGKKAIAHGAFDYLKKPVDIDELKIILTRAVRLAQLETVETGTQENKINSSSDLYMIGQCDEMVKIFDSINKLSNTEVNVLITGESGTGKELCARAIHYHSDRKNFPFVPINCSAIPDTLLESELFGYIKGAFTGANTNKTGLIESADNGTLFLDEIGDMPKHLQAKLLRFLEDQKYQRLGDVVFCQANVRIIAATNRIITNSDNNQFIRTDLYYRLSEFELHLPPLRQRGNDIILLSNMIIEKNRKRFSMPKLKLSKRAEQVVLQFGWPGNIRELENKLSRASISCSNQIIEPEDLLLPVESFNNMTLKDAKDLFEKNFILNGLKIADFKISVAAQNLGISRPTLYDMIKKHGIIIKNDSRIEE